jgi:threonine/homoserine/homoserine lactone efflux protein
MGNRRQPPERMDELQDLLVSALTGFLSGLLLCIPIGPINLTILNEGARRGFKWAVLIGAGATLMELIYCGIAFTGFAAFFQKGWIKSLMEVFSFVFLLFLGTKFVLAKTAAAPMNLGKTAGLIEERIEEKFRPHSAFMTGFVRTLANPGVLLGWIILSANFISRGWVDPTWSSKFACLTGVTLCVGLWFLGLSWAISLGHKKITEQSILKMERGSGIGLLALGLAHGIHIAWQLAKHKM